MIIASLRKRAFHRGCECKTVLQYGWII